MYIHYIIIHLAPTVWPRAMRGLHNDFLWHQLEMRQTSEAGCTNLHTKPSPNLLLPSYFFTSSAARPLQQPQLWTWNDMDVC